MTTKKKLEDEPTKSELPAAPKVEPIEDVPPPPVDTRKTIEHWAEVHKTPSWLFAGAKIGHRWPIGQELTEADYLAGIHAAANVVCR